MRDQLNFGLLQIRNASDPAKSHELECFVRRLEVAPAQVEAIDVLSQRLDQDLYARYDAVLVGGAGEFSVLDDVAPVRQLIEFLGASADRGFPVFGSCFGFQAISLALGGAVEHDAERAEVGTHHVDLTDHAGHDEIFTNLPRRFLAQQGHKDHVTRLPSNARHLAGSELSPYQAARFGEGPVWATQFHPELTHEDNLQRVHIYRDRYIDDLDAVLEALRPSQDTHGLLSHFADLVAARKGGQGASGGGDLK